VAEGARYTSRISVVLAAALLLSACGNPACNHSYSSRGDRESIRELVQDFQKTLRVVQREKNLILLSRAREIIRSRDYLEMEEWVCTAQKQYGRP